VPSSGVVGIALPREQSIRDGQMEVRMRIQGRAEAVQEGDGPRRTSLGRFFLCWALVRRRGEPDTAAEIVQFLVRVELSLDGVPGPPEAL
jgi:hypothetical protein